MMPVGPRDLPKARVLVADPPWAFEDKLPGETRGAAKNYEVLTVSDIMRFPLPDLAEPCLLALWRVASMQQEALDVIRAWGFTLKSEIVWKKKTKNGNDAFGMGRYTRGAHEVALLATRGGRFHVKDKAIRSIFETIVFEAEIGEHSEKPAEFFDILERLSGEGPYVELFGRKGRPGWHVFGNEIESGYLWTPPAVGTVTAPSEAKVSEGTPVCPRCLNLSPGKPAWRSPENPHPGPFTEDLCTACNATTEKQIAAQELVVGEIKTLGDLHKALLARGASVSVMDVAQKFANQAPIEKWAREGGEPPEALRPYIRTNGAAPATAPAPAQEGGKRGRGRGKKGDAPAPPPEPPGAPDARDEEAIRSTLADPTYQRRGTGAEAWIVARVRSSDHDKATALLSVEDEGSKHGPQLFGEIAA